MKASASGRPHVHGLNGGLKNNQLGSQYTSKQVVWAVELQVQCKVLVKRFKININMSVDLKEFRSFGIKVYL